MDKKSKIFFLVFFLLIVSSVAVTYYRIVVQRDYMIEAEADCDPYTESCFVYVCDPEAGEECTGDPIEEENSTDEEGTATGDEAEASTEEATTADESGTETILTRESLVLLKEVNCGKGNTFVSADASTKFPVDADGNYEATFSTEETQLITLTDAQDRICAKAVSLPVYEGRVYMDAKSTAITSVFQTEGIFIAVPEEATTRLVMIEASASFPALLDYVTTELPTKNIATLTAQPEFRNLVKKCAEEVVSKLP